MTKDIGNSYLRFQAIEKILFEKDSLNVERIGNTLKLKLNNGSFVSFINDTIDFESFVYNKNFHQENYYLLAVQYYEGIAYALVDKDSGKLTFIWGKPYFDKSGKKFITCAVDLLAGYGPNGMQYFRVETDTLIKTFACETDKWGPLQVNWLNDTLVQIERKHVVFGNNDVNYKKDYIELILNVL